MTTDMTTKLTYTDVVEDTLAFYQTHPRAVVAPEYGPAQCAYLTKDGCRCAVSRWLWHDAPDQGIKDRVDAAVEWNPNAEALIERESMAIFVPAVQHLTNPQFWLRVQQFHDTEDHWDRDDNHNTLTTKGVKACAHLLEMARQFEREDGSRLSVAY